MSSPDLFFPVDNELALFGEALECPIECPCGKTNSAARQLLGTLDDPVPVKGPIQKRGQYVVGGFSHPHSISGADISSTECQQGLSITPKRARPRDMPETRISGITTILLHERALRRVLGNGTSFAWWLDTHSDLFGGDRRWRCRDGRFRGHVVPPTIFSFGSKRVQLEANRRCLGLSELCGGPFSGKLDDLGPESGRNIIWELTFQGLLSNETAEVYS